MPDENLSRRSSSATADLYYYPEPDPPNPEAIAAERRRIRRRTAILAVSSAILMATVAVITMSGVIAGSPSDTASAPQPAFGPGWVEASPLQRFCRHTEFETACRLAVTNHEAEVDTDGDDDNGNGPHKLLLVLVTEAVEDAQKAYKKAVEISAGGQDRRTRWAVRDCRELLHYAVREVEDCRSEIRATRLLELPVKVAGLMSAFSAAVTYPNTCMDGIADGAGGQNWTAEMAGTAGRAAEGARNCLAMLAWMANSGGKGRRTMEVEGGRVAWHVARDKADVVVAKDGSGDCRSIGEALKLAGKERDERFVIYVKEGVYEEEVKVTVEMNYITMYGDGPHRTVVTGSKGFEDGISVYATATFGEIYFLISFSLK